MSGGKSRSAGGNRDVLVKDEPIGTSLDGSDFHFTDFNAAVAFFDDRSQKRGVFSNNLLASARRLGWLSASPNTYP